MITYGTNPGMGIGISKSIPNASQVQGGAETYKSLAYMGFEEDDVMIGNLLILFSLVVALMDVSKILEHLPKL
jgi:hypothetical protein